MSNESKHTPGPWKKSQDNSLVYSFTVDEPVATISYYSDPKERLSNARLIAAAPEMFEALKRIYFETNLDKHSNELADAVKAIIDKAEGRPA